MYIRVKNVKALPNYELELEFTNNEVKVMDMKPYFHLHIFQELQNPSKFQKVKVAFGTIQWENGADFDPDSLYNLSTKLLLESTQ